MNSFSGAPMYVQMTCTLVSFGLALLLRSSRSLFPVFIHLVLITGITVWSGISHDLLRDEEARLVLLCGVVPSIACMRHFLLWLNERTRPAMSPPPSAWMISLFSGIVFQSALTPLFAIPFEHFPLILFGAIDIFYLYFFLRFLRASRYPHAFFGLLSGLATYLYGGVTVMMVYWQASVRMGFDLMNTLLYGVLIPGGISIVVLFILASGDPDKDSRQFQTEEPENKHDFFGK